MWKFEKKSLLKDFDMSGYTKNQIYVSHGVNDISEIEKIARSVKPDILIIDYVQLIRSNEESEYERLTSIARRIQSLTLELNMATFDLSQVSNDGKQYRKGDIIPAKGSGELIAAANVALVMKASEFP